MANLIPKTPPETWVRTAREALAEEGIHGVKVDRLAQRLGVTRGGFYKHFADRDDLLQRLLVLWETENVFVSDLQSVTDATQAMAMLETLAGRLIEEREFDPSFDLAVRDWARHDPKVAECVERVDATRMARLQKLFQYIGCGAEESEVRARILYYHQIGYYAMGVKESSRQRRRLLPMYLHILTGVAPSAPAEAAGPVARRARRPAR